MSNVHAGFAAEITAIEDVASETKKFSFRCAENAPEAFSEGQFFLLQVDEKTFRAYSIASASAQMPAFDLLIKKVPEGAATEKFLWKKSVGESVNFKGPMGRFGIADKSKKQIFIATGTGLAPMRAFWQQLLEETDSQIELFFGVRSEDYAFCLEELEDLQEKYPERFSATLCLSRPEGIGDFFEGRVTDLAREKEESFFENTEISLCGGKAMIDEIKEILQNKNFEGTLNIESW